MAAEKTTTPTFTPGPWEICTDRVPAGKVDFVVVESFAYDAIEIVRDAEGHNDNPLGTAHLIAAAPDLYEALKDMREAVAAMLRVIAMHPGTIAEEFGEEIQRAGVAVGFGTRAQHAIAKAEGREP